MNTNPTPDALAELIAELPELLAEADGLPWAYRPQDGDDWGIIRTTIKGEFGWCPVVAVSRGGGDPAAHRRDKTDPYEPNGRLTVAAVNAIPRLLAASQHEAKERGDLRYALGMAGQCLSFFASVIRSGEPWTETCESQYREVKDAMLKALVRAPTEVV